MDLVVPPSATSTFSATDFFELPETGQMDFSSSTLRDRVISVCHEISRFPTGEKLLAQLGGWCRKRDIVLVFQEEDDFKNNSSFFLSKTSRVAEDSLETTAARDGSTALSVRCESGCEKRKHYVIRIHSGSGYSGILHYAWNPSVSKVETCDYTFEIALIECLFSTSLVGKAPEAYSACIGKASFDHRFVSAQLERVITGFDVVTGENAPFCVNQLRMERGEPPIYSTRIACRIFPFPGDLKSSLQDFLHRTSNRLFFALANVNRSGGIEAEALPPSGDHQDRILADIDRLLEFDMGQRLCEELSNQVRDERRMVVIGLCMNRANIGAIVYDPPFIVYPSDTTNLYTCFNSETGYTTYTLVTSIEIIFEHILALSLHFRNPEQVQSLIQTPAEPGSQWRSVFHKRLITGVNPDGSQEEMCVNQLREQMGLPHRCCPPPALPAAED